MNPPPPFSPYYQPPPPPSPSPQLVAPTPAPDLSATLCALSSLLSHTQTTLNSLSPFLPPPSPSHLVACPFNPTHSLPPSSLFSHYLSCPSSFAPISDPTFSQNFFYSDCPGAVTVGSENPNGPASPVLTLPEFLSDECADIYGFEHKGFAPDAGITPSEIWAVRSEIEGWFGYPSSYSCRLLRSILSTCKSDFQCLFTWVIENSLKYGVVIDLGIRDHIVLLFKLCMKAILREAISLFKDIRGEGVLDCPVLMTAMAWLGSQLSILYGEARGNSFAITMLKEFVLESALHTSYFPVVEKAKESSEHGDSEGAPWESGVQKTVISVHQVAAAVAALYERYWLEENIKKLRGAAHLTAYQRFLEHENISNSARVERQERSNYRPIIDHDGLLSKRSRNQEPNRIKTPAELLAEERDYKRRRMSYRGKKMKRTTVQVMRDIIDEFMEEIQLAGGPGSVKETEGAEATGFGSSSVHSVTSDVLDPTKQQSPYVHRSKNAECDYGEKQKYDSRYYGNADNARSIIRERHDRKDKSRDNDRQKADWPIHEHTRHREYSEGNGETVYHSSGSSLRKRYENKERSHHRVDSRHDSEHSHNHPRKKKDRRSVSVHTEFEDRYDPSNSHNHARKKKDPRSDSVHAEFEDRYDPSNVLYNHGYYA